MVLYSCAVSKSRNMLTPADFRSILNSKWQNPKGINESLPFIYYIGIKDIKGGREYRYVGKARDRKRIEEYSKNMAKIARGQPRGKKQRYRAVHFVLYTAIRQGWEIEMRPLKSSPGKNDESELQKKHNCNLNGMKTWPVEELSTLTIEDLGVKPIKLLQHNN